MGVHFVETFHTVVIKNVDSVLLDYLQNLSAKKLTYVTSTFEYGSTIYLDKYWRFLSPDKISLYDYGLNGCTIKIAQSETNINFLNIFDFFDLDECQCLYEKCAI